MAGESKLQAKISTLCKSAGILCFKLNADGQRGFPDLLLLRGGVIVFLELKNPNGKGKLSAPQVRMVEKFKAQRANIYVVENLEEFYVIQARHYG